jgi:hypothetical protein
VSALAPSAFDGVACRVELDALTALLASKASLSEKRDLLPHFRRSPQLVAFIGTLFPNIFPANRYAHELRILGHFAADFLIGNYERKTFCAIELEDARPNSVFQRVRGRARPVGPPAGDRVRPDRRLVLLVRQPATDRRVHRQLRLRADRVLRPRSCRPHRSFDRHRARPLVVAINTHKVYCWTYDDLCYTLETNLVSLTTQTPGR